MIYKYAHPEFFSDWAKPDLESLNGEIILYGAGRRGSVAAHCLEKRGIDFICFCDSDEKKQGVHFCGHDVVSPKDLREKHHDAAILITTNHYYYVAEQLKKEGFPHVFSCVSLFSEIDFTGYSLYAPEYMCRNIDQYFFTLIDNRISYIPQVQIVTTMRCTMRCKECTSYIPYCEGPGEDFDAQEIIRAIDRLLVVYEKIGTVLLYGGEPLLYKDLPLLIDAFCQNPQIEKVAVVTNGTVLPNERLLTALSHKKAYMRVTDYGPLVKKMDQVVDLLRSRGIPTEVTNFKFWNRTPTVENLNETPEQLYNKVQNCCTIANATTLIGGKLFFCNFSAFFDYFHALPDFGDNYVNLLDQSETNASLKEKIDKIRNMAKQGIPKKACRYCNFNTYNDDLPVGEQTREVLTFDRIF